MKRIILSALIVSLALTINAQKTSERKSGEHGMHHKMDRKKGHRMNMQNLNLTEDQKAKFKTQKETFRNQMEALKKNDNITVKEWKAKKEAISKEHKNKMQSIFTPDQKAQIEKNKLEAKKKHEAMGKERAEKMKTHLGLTDAQVAQMDKNKADMQLKIKTLKEDKKLTDEQKKEKFKDLRKSQKESMKSIFTEEQLKKMKESKHRKRGGHDGDRKKSAAAETI